MTPGASVESEIRGGRARSANSPSDSHPRHGRSLRELTRVVLSPRPPYHLQGSFIKPSHFRTADCVLGRRTVWQTMRIEGRVLGIRLSGNREVWRPRISVDVYGEGTLPGPQRDSLVDLLNRRLDTESDLSGFFRLVRRTPRGRRTLLRWMGSRPTCPHSLYELLVVLICLQNTQVRRTETMMQRLFEEYGDVVQFDRHSLRTFWDPRALVGEECRLRELRLGYRARTLERLSGFFAGNEREIEARLWALSDPDLANALLELPGVGPATAGGLMFEYFHRYDYLVHLPPWDTKIFQRLFRTPRRSSLELVDLAHRTWPGYSMLALHLLFEDQFWRMRDGAPNVLAGLTPPSCAAPRVCAEGARGIGASYPGLTWHSSSKAGEDHVGQLSGFFL